MTSSNQLARCSAGQAAVETAIAMPMSLFVILGVLQLSLIQQGRLLADYAAYKGARAASVGRAECKTIAKAEIAALVPALGRADTAAKWVETYNQFSNNKDPKAGLPVVYTEWKLTDVVKPFDKQLSPDKKPEKVHLRLYFFYPMRIPFANWLLARYFLAERGLETWANLVDPINPVAHTQAPPSRPSGSAVVIAKSYFDQGLYVIPVQASWSLRMFSQAKDTEGGCQ